MSINPEDLDLGDLDLGEIDLGEIDLGSLDLGDLDLGETPTPTDEDPSFFEVLGRTVDELQASGWAGWRVMGEHFGNERMVEAGNQGVAFNEAQAAKYGRPMIIEDIEGVDDAVDYVFTNALPQVLPSIAVSLPTAFAVAKLGAVIGSVVPVVGTVAGGVIGGALGAFLPSFFLGMGEIDREMKRRAGDDHSDPIAAMGGGAFVGMLDTAALAVGLKGVLPHLLKRTGGGRAVTQRLIDRMVKDGVPTHIAKRGLYQGLAAAAAEGSTEAMQELAEDHVAELSTGVSSEEGELTSSLINAFALGVVGGGPLGAISGVSVQRSRNERFENEVRLKKEDKEFQKELDTWIKDQNFQGKSVNELRQYAIENGIKILDSDLSGNDAARKATIIEKIREGETRKRTEVQAQQLMERAGLMELSMADRVDSELRLLETYSNEELLQEAGKQGVALSSLPFIKDLDSVKIFLANNKARAQFEKSGESKAGMDTQTFRRHLQDLSATHTRKELLQIAEKLNIPLEKLAVSDEVINQFATGLITKQDALSQTGKSHFEIATIIGKHNAILEINNSNIEALANQKDIIELDVEPEQATQARIQKEIEKGRPVEFVAGNRVFTQAAEEGQIVYRNESGQTYEDYIKEAGDVEKGLPITRVTLRKGSFRNQQEGFLNKFLAALKGGAFGFQPSGPLGFEAFIADRDRLGRLRAINKAAQNLAYQYEEAKLAALQRGEITNEQEADQLVMDYLSKAKTTVELDAFNRALKEIQIKELKTFLKNATEQKKKSIEREIAFLEKQIEDNVDTIEKVRSLDQLPAGMRDFAIKSRGLIDTLSSRLLKELPTEILNEQIGDKTRKEVIEENLGKYLTQSFKIFEPDLGYNPISFWNKLGLTKGSRAAKQKVDAAKERYRKQNAVDHPLQGGETLESIAQAKRTTVAVLEELNPILPSPLQAGYEIKIPASEIAANNFIKNLLENRKEGFTGNEVKLMAGLRPSKEEKTQIDIPTGVLQERQTIPKEYKELMGEITNPGQVITNTVARVASILENMRFYNRIEELSNIPGQRIFSPVQGGPFTIPLEEKLGLPISGMYTTPQVAEAIAVTEKNKSALYKLYEAFVLLPKVAIQAGKTVYSISAQMRNFLSASLFYLGNGHIGGKRLVESINILRDELFAGGFDTQGRPISRRVKAEKTYRKLLELGIINTNARLGEILQTFDEVAKDPSGDMSQIVARLIGYNGSQSFGRKLITLPNKLYTAADDFWKIAAFGSERMRIKNKFSSQDTKRLSNYASHIGLKESVANKSYEDMIDEVAAYKVRQTIPNYDYVGNFANMIRKTPVGNFIAFPTEIFRTGFNIAGLALKDMTFSGMRGEGLRRAIGFGTATYGLSFIVQQVAQALSDVTDEELEAAKRVVGDWAKYSPLIPIEKIPSSQGGGFTYVDGSYILVYDEISKIIPTIMTASGEKNAEGAAYPASVLYGMKTAVLNVLEPYMYLSIAGDVQRQVLENRDANGYNIANPEDDLGPQAVDYLNYTWSKIQPGAWTQIQAVKEGLAADETSFKRYGKLQETPMATLSLMGMRTDRVNPTLSFKYNINNYKNRMKDAGYQFKDLVNDYGLVTPEDLLQGYEEANSSVFDIQRELYLDFLATRTLNGNQKVIKNQLKNRLPGKYSKLRQGRFDPYTPAKSSKAIYDEITKEMQRKAVDVYGINTITKRRYPKRELKDRETFYKRGRFSLLLPLPRPWED